MASFKTRQKSSNIDDRRAQVYGADPIADTLNRMGSNFTGSMTELGGIFGLGRMTNPFGGPVPDPDKLVQLTKAEQEKLWDRADARKAAIPKGPVQRRDMRITHYDIDPKSGALKVVREALPKTTSTTQKMRELDRQDALTNVTANNPKAQLMSAKVKSNAPAKSLSEREILAYTLLGEAAGEGKNGMAAVMQVIKNRTESGQFRSTNAATALQSGQFAAWNQGAKSLTSKFTQSQLNEALKVVDGVLDGSIPDQTGGALYYYANKGANAISRPGWFDRNAKGGATQIGNHVFASSYNPNDADKLAFTMAGSPVPASMPPTVQVARNAKSLAEAIDYLPASQQELARITGGLAVPNATRQMLQEREAARQAASVADSGSGLVARPVTTVAIDPRTGMPYKPGASAPNSTRIDLQDREASRQQKSSVPPSGSIRTNSGGGSVTLPQGVVPQVPNLPPNPASANATLNQERADQQPRFKVVTVKVKNPKYLGQSAKSIQKLQDIHDIREEAVMTAQTPQGEQPLVVEEPEFIEQQITVPIKPQAAPRPAAQAPVPATPQQEALARRNAALQIISKNPTYYNPNQVAAIQAGKNVYDVGGGGFNLMPTMALNGKPRYTYGDTGGGTSGGSLGAS